MLNRMLADATIWKDRAEKCRAVADAIHDPTAKAQMRSVADSYERMAEHAAQRPLRTDNEMKN